MSTYNQKSFGGGMNLHVDDTRLDASQYRVAFNVRNSTDTLVPVKQSVRDFDIVAGVKQGILTFGNYILVFVAGRAYYRFHTDTGWAQIDGFQMSTTAPRFWTEFIPVSITNYRRQALAADDVTAGATLDNNIGGLSAGNLPGLLVQDNVNQPQFIFLDVNGNLTSRTTQSYDEWDVEWGPSPAYTEEDDKREYVPIGSAMAFVDGILWVVSKDGNKLYRSVTGRPLDFLIIVDTDGNKPISSTSDADATAYSVGVGGITTLRGLSDGSLFVGAGNANFSVNKNAGVTICGEPTFTRKFLFNATCLSDRGLIDSLGDTRFIDITGVRSFNAVLQTQNEGRNSAFTNTIADALKGELQQAITAAAILYNNDELYALDTIFGPVIAVYDSIQGKWVGFDINQTGGQRIKQFAKIESTIQKLFAITEDDKLYELYGSTVNETAHYRSVGINSAVLDAPHPNLLQHELKPTTFRCILNNITVNTQVSLTAFVNNRQSRVPQSTKQITFSQPITPYAGPLDLPELDTQLENLCWSIPSSEQGWKVFFILSWTGGAVLTQISATFRDETPMNPLNTQASVV